jgi:alpha-N-arabinofuranosidase
MKTPGKAWSLLALIISASATTDALSIPEQLPTLEIQASQPKAKVSPVFYGLMTEEINFSYEGGIYGELLRNRTFKADSVGVGMQPEAYDPAKYYPAHFIGTNAPKYWKAVGNATLSLDTNNPLNSALNVSLRLDATSAAKTNPAGIANGGYWGIPVTPKTTYRVSSQRLFLVFLAL